ncbi:MAG TPA: PIN domain-containing protein [Gemmatimonadales bacterium]|jgi:predicted nucleic acid-binding protein
MSEPIFVDTNVLVYARDLAVPDKQRAAALWLEHLWEVGAGRVSFQVLHEFYVTVTRKLNPGLSRAEARDDVRTLFAWQPVMADRIVIEAAWTLQERYDLSWWDALIVAAASRAGCRLLLTEDFQEGQELGGVRITNPFTVRPADLQA